jgi:hypothetical protein
MLACMLHVSVLRSKYILYFVCACGTCRLCWGVCSGLRWRVDLQQFWASDGPGCDGSIAVVAVIGVRDMCSGVWRQMWLSASTMTADLETGSAFERVQRVTQDVNYVWVCISSELLALCVLDISRTGCWDSCLQCNIP